MGWTMAQVTTAVGNPGDATSQSAMQTIITYQGATTGSSANIIFVNGAVYTKTQTGLC